MSKLASGAPARRSWRVIALFVGIVGVQVAMGALSVDLLSAARTYVFGESLWSKAQRDALFDLQRYAGSRDEAAYREFLDHLHVPLSFRRARELLDAHPADVVAARAELVAGGIDAADVDALVRSYLWFHDLPFVRDAIAAWKEGDRGIEAAVALAATMHREIGPGADAQVPAAALARLPALNAELNRLETEFSNQLGRASRAIRMLLLVLNPLLALSLTLAGLQFARRTLRVQAQAERALRESVDRWNLAADAARIGMFAWHADGGRFHLDGRGAALHGMAPRAADFAAWLETVVADDRARVEETMRGAARDARAFTLRYRVAPPAGGIRHLELIGQSHAGEAPAGSMTGIVRDVTDDVHAEQLRLEKDAAEQANRAKSAFLSRVSHELRTPLNAILGFGQLMEHDQRAPLPLAQAQRIKHVLHGGRYLLRLVDDILDITAAESGAAALTLAPVDVAQAVAAAQLHTDPIARERGVRIGVAPAQPRLAVLADALRLEQVLVNLLSNAIKYNRAHGSVTVEWSVRDAQVAIAVRDTGAGLSAEQVAQLFQPFNRLGAETSRVEGAGLGLVVAHEFVARMGGTIEVASEPGAGSCFTVVLARAGDGARDATADAPAATPPATAPPSRRAG